MREGIIILPLERRSYSFFSMRRNIRLSSTKAYTLMLGIPNTGYTETHCRISDRARGEGWQAPGKGKRIGTAYKGSSKNPLCYPAFSNYKVDFTPPQITEKVPSFGTGKWVEGQNQNIAKQFTETIHKIESLYINDTARQVEVPMQYFGILRRTIPVAEWCQVAYWKRW